MCSLKNFHPGSKKQNTRWAFLVLFALLSCGKDPGKLENEQSLALQVSDSVRVDYEGILFLRDYHETKGLFLGEDYQQGQLIEFDGQGQILNRILLSTEGPNRLEAYQAGINYLGDSIAMVLYQNQIVFLNRSGAITGKIMMETGSFYINGLMGRNIFPLGDHIAYLRPENMEMLEDYGDLFSSVYSNPIVEIYKPATQEWAMTMEFPPQSIYKPGSYRFWTFPTIKKKGQDYFLFFLAEPWFYHYQENNGEILFKKRVKIPEVTFVQRKSVPLNQSDDYWEITGNIIQGRIMDIYPLKEGLVVVYRKGINETITQGLDINDRETRQALDEQHNPFYWAYFDASLEGKTWDQPSPKGLIWTPAVTKEGKMVAMKDQEYSGVEESHHIFYLIELVKN